ncbi:hypothetical protein EDD15DRAFT_2191635 [Pisolithus albus]|nr:hypothetical protein EDD15DRAFT_2191635 [Pisolithus albus]
MTSSIGTKGKSLRPDTLRMNSGQHRTWLIYHHLQDSDHAITNFPTAPQSTAQKKQKCTRTESLSLSEGREGIQKRTRNENKPLTQENSTGRKAAKTTRQQYKAKQKAEGDKAMERLGDVDRNWTDSDTTLLLEALLGSESTYFNTLMVNATRAFKKVSAQVFSGQRTIESVRGRYERMRKLFTYILNYESITGNGGGDPDVETLDEQIENARLAGKDVGNLSGAMLKKFYTLGWYDLFNDRLGEHPGLMREEEFRSGSLSDTVEISSDGENDSETESWKVPSKLDKPTSRKPGSSSSTASKNKAISQKGTLSTTLRHRRQISHGGFGTEATEFFSSNTQYLKATMDVDKERLTLLKQREAREEKQHDLLVAKGIAEVRQAEMDAKVRHAREVMLMEGMPEEVKARAREVLLSYFSINKKFHSNRSILSPSIAIYIYIIEITIVILICEYEAVCKAISTHRRKLFPTNKREAIALWHLRQADECSIQHSNAIWDASTIHNMPCSLLMALRIAPCHDSEAKFSQGTYYMPTIKENSSEPNP